jgi:hypothetical protein
VLLFFKLEDVASMTLLSSEFDVGICIIYGLMKKRISDFDFKLRVVCINWWAVTKLYTK